MYKKIIANVNFELKLIIITKLNNLIIIDNFAIIIICTF